MNVLKHLFCLSCGVAIPAILLAQSAVAATFTITDGQTVTTTQVLDTPGDTIRVEQGGIINVSPGNGIRATADGVTVNNAGSVTGSGAGAAGIWVNGSSTIINSGTAEGDRLGIYADGNTNTITNAGTAEGGSFGIRVDGTDNTVTNAGRAKGGNFGMFAFGNRSTITNAGRVEGDSSGIIAEGTGNTITNTGGAKGGFEGITAFGTGNTITNAGTVEGGDYGIRVDLTGNTITNAGRAKGGIFGIYAFGNGHTITNAGTLEGGDYGIRVAGSDNTIILLSGSTIEGRLELEGASNRLIIGRGLDAVFSVTGTPTISTEGAAHVVSGNTVYTVNATAFAVQDDLASDLTRAVTGAVEGRLAAARRLDGGLRVALNGLTIAAAADPSVAADNGFWLSGLAASRSAKQDGDVAGFDTGLLGLVGGFDALLTDATRLGLYGGFSKASLDADIGPLQDLDSSIWFGGLYLGHDWDAAFLEATLTAGWSGFDSTRRVANNTVAGGIEQAKADYGGVLLSPSVRIGTAMAAGSGTLTPSLRLRYTGLFLDSYRETGSAAALAIDERTISIFELRGEIAYDFALGNLAQTLRIGLDGAYSDAGDAAVTVAGQALAISIGEEGLARGFLGYDAAYALGDSASLTFSTEAGIDTTEAVTLEARAGISWRF